MHRALDKTALGEGHAASTANNHVIKYADIDKLERVAKRPGKSFVGSARLGHARRMVVIETHGSRSQFASTGEYLAWMRETCIDCPQ